MTKKYAGYMSMETATGIINNQRTSKSQPLKACMFVHKAQGKKTA